MSSNQSGEGEIRKNIIEADLVDCMVALPGQLFYATQIPVCLWFLARQKRNGRFRDRRGETLFIDARKMGTLTDRVHRELNEEDVAKIAGTYHGWRGDKNAGTYADVRGFCKTTKLDDIRLSPSRTRPPMPSTLRPQRNLADWKVAGLQKNSCWLPSRGASPPRCAPSRAMCRSTLPICKLKPVARSAKPRLAIVSLK
jgi:hypothetical protein